MATVYPTCEAVVADLPGVHHAVESTARRGGRIADRLLAQHREPADDTVSSISVERDGRDWLFSLEDTGGGAVYIELGHTAEDGTPVEGLRVLGRAAAQL